MLLFDKCKKRFFSETNYEVFILTCLSYNSWEKYFYLQSLFIKRSEFYTFVEYKINSVYFGFTVTTLNFRRRVIRTNSISYRHNPRRPVTRGESYKRGWCGKSFIKSLGETDLRLLQVLFLNCLNSFITTLDRL